MTTPQSNLGLAAQGVLERVVALEMLALPGTNAVPYPWYRQDSWPYWTNWTNGLTPQRGDQKSVQRADYSIELRLVAGHLSSTYEGQIQYDAALMVADVVAFFVRHDRLAVPDAEDTALRKPPRWTAPQGHTFRAGRLGFFEMGDVVQVFQSFIIDVPLNVNNEA